MAGVEGKRKKEVEMRAVGRYAIISVKLFGSGFSLGGWGETRRSLAEEESQ